MTIAKSMHHEYKSKINQWIRIRDCLEGADAIKSKRYTYVPRLKGQTQSEYDAYVNRGLFSSITSRVLDGLAGMMTRKSPSLEYDEILAPYFEDSNASGLSFYELFEELCRELMAFARYFLFIDWPQDGGDPYIVSAKTEQVVNWKYSNNTLDWVVIEEAFYQQVDPKDPFENELKYQYRLLKVDASGYSVTVYNDKGEVISGPIYPTVEGEVLDFIPGFFISQTGVNSGLAKAPLLDLADLNIAHFRNSCDLEKAIHFSALPSLVVTGASADSEIVIGSDRAIILPDEKANVFWADFKGEGLTFLENALKDKISQMALFSARISDQSTRGSEAANSVALRYSSESATLSTTLRACETALNLIYGWIAKFKRVEEPEIELSRDFVSTKLTAAELKAVTDAYLAGTIDREAYLDILFRGELIDASAAERMEADDVTPHTEEETSGVMGQPVIPETTTEKLDATLGIDD
jgi:hypothetical protein